MKEESHQQVLKEVLDEISAALKDEKGLQAHQRRLAFSLSLGAVNLLELYFHKLNIIKGGTQINHIWFNRKKETILDYLQNQLTSPIKEIENIDKILDLLIKLEEKRDDLAYGSPVKNEILQEKINLFFELKKLTKC